MKDFLQSDERIDTVNENITLIQKKDGLTFGTDALLLSAFMRENKNAVAADLGAGTGIISFLSAARSKFKKIFAVEIQKEFHDLILRNTELNNFGDRVFPVFKDVRELLPCDTEGELDVVFSNPPYMKSDSGKSNDALIKAAARHEINGDIGDFCACAARLLKYGGLFYVVYRPDRLAELISSMTHNTLEPKRMTLVYANEKSEPCLVLIEAKKGAKCSMKNTPPLIIYKDVSNAFFTDEMQKIYDEGKLF